MEIGCVYSAVKTVTSNTKVQHESLKYEMHHGNCLASERYDISDTAQLSILHNQDNFTRNMNIKSNNSTKSLKKKKTKIFLHVTQQR
jgi:hypothetical protein